MRAAVGHQRAGQSARRAAVRAGEVAERPGVESVTRSGSGTIFRHDGGGHIERGDAVTTEDNTTISTEGRHLKHPKPPLRQGPA